MLHELSPFAGEPVDCVVWVRAEEVVANDYNPNVMAPAEKKGKYVVVEAVTASFWGGTKVAGKCSLKAGCRSPAFVVRGRERSRALRPPSGITVRGGSTR